MVQRRDHLLAVRARLIALSSSSLGGSSSTGGGTGTQAVPGKTCRRAVLTLLVRTLYLAQDNI